jgi:two-component system sensor histidine kinase/response regulator
LQALENKDYDLILMDVQMPEMDGYEATSAIRKGEIKPAIPIIGLTANAMKGDREKCIEAGMDDYLSKPMRPNLLYAIIEKWT